MAVGSRLGHTGVSSDSAQSKGFDTVILKNGHRIRNQRFAQISVVIVLLFTLIRLALISLAHVGIIT